MTTKIFSIVLIIGLLLAAPNTTFAATPADKVECGFWETLFGCKETPNNKPQPQPSPKPTPKLPVQGTQIQADQGLANDLGIDIGSTIVVLASTIAFFPATGGGGVDQIKNPCDAAKAFWGHMIDRRPTLLPLIEAGIAAAAVKGFDHTWMSSGGLEGVSKFVADGKIFVLLWGAPRLLTSFDVTAGNLSQLIKGLNKVKDAASLKTITAAAGTILGCKPQTASEWASAKTLAQKEYKTSAQKIEVYEAPPISLVPTPLRVATPSATTHTLNSTGKYVVPIEFRGLTDQEICYLLAAGIIIFVGVTIVSTGGTSAPALVFALAVVP